MYSVGDVLIADTVAPIIQDFQLTPGPGTLNVMVAGTDATTLAAGATLLYSINGGPELEFPIPFDDPALLEDTMFFEGDLDNLPGGSTITGRAALFDDVGNLALSQPLQVTVPPVNIQLGPGWNMFSIPGTPVNTDPNSLVGPGSQIILPLYRWNPSGFSYEQVTELRLGESYWILTLNPSGETIQVPVIPASTYTASLPQGWNMIGSVSGDADFSDPQDNPDGSILPPIYFWDPIGFAYVPASTVEPGKGYWTLSLQPCTLTVTVSNSPAPPSLTGAQSQSFAQNNAPTFRFTLRVESPGESQKLVLGWDEAATGDLDRLDLVLPPVPPMGMPFDAYFEQSSFRLGRAIQPLVEGATWTMRIIADESVKLRWDKAALPDRFTLVANTPSGDVDFRSIDFLALPQGEHKITIRLKPRELPPTVSKLLPNFPNPFNPETWIPYQLSEENPVTITIYNVEGKKVRTLSLGFKLSGYYLTRDKAAYWDGRNTSGEPVASGVYFYTLKAGKFTDTRKMLILK
ncbi:T9SS type A sorting domain-containing protein [Candidatus Poribacteria bacterium]|nr:T9SS type A sorting domain-containing protein [Candidatus Poribacteria bacterium]